MLKLEKSKQLIYLDHAATTPVRPEVLRAMQPYWSLKFGNPSAIYSLGLEAKAAIDEARALIASTLQCKPQEVVYTAGGTESINLAILGVARQYRKAHKTGGHIITSTIEHHAVLHAVAQLSKEGFSITKIKVNSEGFFNLAQLKKTFRPDTVLVSLMYANNEIGTIEPIREVGSIIRAENTRRQRVTRYSSFMPVLFHTDACQAAGFLDIRPARLGVDLLSINGSKIYGPKQTGALYVRSGVQLAPLIFGGGQEQDLRSGTENVPGVVGLAKALFLAQQERVREVKRLLLLQNYTIRKLLALPNVTLNGPQAVGPLKITGHDNLTRLPNNVNVSFAGAEGEALMLYLDAYNIAVATGSACTTTSADPSHVLVAIGLSKRNANSGIRLTFGRATTKKQIDYVLRVLPKVLKTVRSMTKLN